MFSSAVVHASVNKQQVERQAEKERKETEEAEKLAKTQKVPRGISLVKAVKGKEKETAPTKSKSPEKNADLDTSFDRHALVDKINKLVEFIYVPTYQQMRKMILKALKLQARRI